MSGDGGDGVHGQYEDLAAENYNDGDGVDDGSFLMNPMFLISMAQLQQ